MARAYWRIFIFWIAACCQSAAQNRTATNRRDDVRDFDLSFLDSESACREAVSACRRLSPSCSSEECYRLDPRCGNSKEVTAACAAKTNRAFASDDARPWNATYDYEDEYAAEDEARDPSNASRSAYADFAPVEETKTIFPSAGRCDAEGATYAVRFERRENATLMTKCGDLCRDMRCVAFAFATDECFVYSARDYNNASCARADSEGCWECYWLSPFVKDDDRITPAEQHLEVLRLLDEYKRLPNLVTAFRKRNTRADVINISATSKMTIPIDAIDVRKPHIAEWFRRSDDDGSGEIDAVDLFALALATLESVMRQRA